MKIKTSVLKLCLVRYRGGVEVGGLVGLLGRMKVGG